MKGQYSQNSLSFVRIRMWLVRTFGTCERVFTDFAPVAGLSEDGPVVIHIQHSHYQQLCVLRREKRVSLRCSPDRDIHSLWNRYSPGYAVLCHGIYPACDARVVWVVFDGDGEAVFSHSLSVQRPVHMNHTWLEGKAHQSVHYYLFFPSAVFVLMSLTVSLM